MLQDDGDICGINCVLTALQLASSDVRKRLRDVVNDDHIVSQLAKWLRKLN